jgi:hypothetical protein
VSDRWVATTLKINPGELEADAGIRIGIYPERHHGERPVLDENRNLILCPLPYNGAFIELFYASFFIVKTVLAEDARLPHPVQLYASDDRYVAQELVGRRAFPVEAIVEAFGQLAQPELIEETLVGDLADEATDAVAPVAQTKR